jgi:hypothetical protein
VLGAGCSGQGAGREGAGAVGSELQLLPVHIHKYLLT